MSGIKKILILMVCALLGSHVFAQEYPTKPIKIIVGFSPGGSADAVGRSLAEAFSTRLGQPVVVENRAGANGNIAAETVARAAPDGYTVLFGYIATHGINPALQRLKYDPIADFEPIGMVANSPTLLVVTNNLPVSNAKELVALLKAKPDSISYASAGMGTAPHLTAELFQINTGTQMLHVPYKGSGPALVDTIGGTTQVMFPSLFSAFPQVTGGKLKALGIAGEKRAAVLPNVPTLKEQGIPNMSVTQWYALFAPAKTPQPIIARLNKELNLILNDKATEKKIEDQGAEVETGTPEQLKNLVKSEVVRWKKLVDSAKITVD